MNALTQFIAGAKRNRFALDRFLAATRVIKAAPQRYIIGYNYFQVRQFIRFRGMPESKTACIHEPSDLRAIRDGEVLALNGWTKREDAAALRLMCKMRRIKIVEVGQ